MTSNDAQMIEVLKARERLIEYKNKIQCYPPYPDRPLESIPAITPPEHRLYRKMQEIQGLVNNTRMQIQSHIQSHSSKKKVSKYD